jgi:amino-acid N-acetyltransferase
LVESRVRASDRLDWYYACCESQVRAVKWMSGDSRRNARSDEEEFRVIRPAIESKPSRAAAAALLEAAGLPSEDLTEAHMAHFFYCGPAAAPTALVGVELCGSSALLRSLVVRPEHRSAGLGAALVEHAEIYARMRGARAIYLLTTTAEAFFGRRGYARADRASAPAQVAATREFATLCPASSAFMIKRL